MAHESNVLKFSSFGKENVLHFYSFLGYSLYTACVYVCVDCSLLSFEVMSCR
jgi:hypothetical protein